MIFFEMIKKIIRKIFSLFDKAYISIFKLIIKISQKKNIFKKDKLFIFLGNNKNILHNLLKELDKELSNSLKREYETNQLFATNSSIIVGYWLAINLKQFNY